MMASTEQMMNISVLMMQSPNVLAYHHQSRDTMLLSNAKVEV
jgi:hypothetical protein